MALGFFIWSLSYFSLSTSYERVLRQFRGEKARFVEDFLQNEIDGPFDGEPIATICRNKTWTKGLIFNCDPPAGGIGKVRNAHLNCIRLAIEAGAELVMPEIVRRYDRDISKVTPHSKGTPRGVSLDYFYDKDHLNWTLSTFCPQMRLYQSINDLWDQPMPNPISTKEFKVDRVSDTVIKRPETWAPMFKEFFDTHSNPKTRTWPTRINVVETMYAWPTTYDPPAFVQNFGRMLRFRHDTRQLAAFALYTLEKKLKVYGSMPKQWVEGGTSNGFVGVHLRTEKDIWGANWPPYDEQAAYYLDYIVQSQLPVVYLASGATTENITAITERARDFNVTVVTKKDLLEPEELYYLSELTWDQQALVDWEIMLRARLVAGMAESAFAWNIAIRRASAIGYVGGGSDVVPVAEHIRWQDRLSVIMGKKDKNSNMQLAIWP